MFTKVLNVELTLVSFKPADNSDDSGAPAPVRPGYVGDLSRVLRAVRDSGYKRYNGVPRNRLLHGAKEGRGRTLDDSDKGQDRGRSSRQGGEWKDPLTDGKFVSTTGVLMVGRLRSGVGEMKRD